MTTTILLAMSEDMGQALKSVLENKAPDFKVYPTIISLVHSLPDSLVKYQPDILLLHPGELSYDTLDHDGELVQSIIQIRSNPEIANTRISAIGASGKNGLLSKLVSLQVWDIFPASNNGQIPINQIINQLKRPATLSNVSEFASTAINSNSFGTVPTVPPASSSYQTSPVSAGVSSNEISALKSQLATMTEREGRLASRSEMRLIPRDEYDALLEALNAKTGTLPEQVKEQVSHVLSLYKKQNKTIDDLTAVVKDQKNQLTINANSVSKQDYDALQRENQQLKAQLAQANAQINNLQAQNDYDDYDDDYRPRSKKTSNRSSSSRIESKGNSPLKPIAIGLAVVAIIAVMAVVILPKLGASNNTASTTAQSAKREKASKPSFDSLIKEGEYEKAAKAYPSKAVQAENAMLKDSSVDDKQTVAQNISSYSSADTIQLDVDYFSKSFSSVVDLWHESTDSDIVNPIPQRRIMIAYALMKTNNLSDAEEVAKPLKNDNMNKRIEAYKNLYNANKTLQKAIDSGNLSKSEKKKAEKQMSKNQATMDKL